MSLCVQIVADGTLAATGQPIEECTGYVMVSGSEFAIYQTIQQLFQQPTPEVLMSWVVGPMGTIFLCYLTAYCVGRVVGMFND